MEWWVPLEISLKVSLCSSIIVFFIGTAIAYILAMKNFPGKRALEIAVMLPLVLPPTVTGYYLILIFGKNGLIGRFLHDLFGVTLIFSWQGAVVASAVVALPLMVQAAKSAIESVDRHFIQVSYTLGHSELDTAVKVIFPLAKNGILAGFILAFSRALGEFGATLMLAGNIPGETNTMPIEIYSLASFGEWGKAQIFVVVLTLVSALAVFASRFFSGYRTR
ncbi:MAG TPA: molybdate ABC transporter permease subunit [Candidatus Rifleibacterium sp.]|nr:molybdate ABC transporter permease subunit [Candidatus Rifleibacterium sp.]